MWDRDLCERIVNLYFNLYLSIPFQLGWLLIRWKTFLTTANINNTSRKLLQPEFLSLTHYYVLGKRSELRFLRPDLPRACLVYEVTQTTIDVPVWRLICQAHQLAFTSDAAPSSTKDRHWLTEIAYHSFLARARVASTIITRARIYLVKGIACSKSHASKRCA